MYIHTFRHLSHSYCVFTQPAFLHFRIALLYAFVIGAVA